MTKRGFKDREFRTVPIGMKPTFVTARIPHLKCKDCELIRQETLSWADKKAYARRLARIVLALLDFGTVKDVSRCTGEVWHAVKGIEKEWLKQHYSKPRLKDV